MIYEGIINGLTINMRSIEERDAELTYAMRHDVVKTKYMHPTDGTVEDQRNYILKQREKENDYLFVVMDKKDKIIGMRGIYNITDSQAESGRTIGYGDAFQNMEALILGLDFAFINLGVQQVLMDAAVENSAVRRIQIQLGAKEYKRDYLPGLEYEYVFSTLKYDDYCEAKKKIMKLIESHIRRESE